MNYWDYDPINPNRLSKELLGFLVIITYIITQKNKPINPTIIHNPIYIFFFPNIQWIGLRENLNRKPQMFPLNMGFSCKLAHLQLMFPARNLHLQGIFHGYVSHNQMVYIYISQYYILWIVAKSTNLGWNQEPEPMEPKMSLMSGPREERPPFKRWCYRKAMEILGVYHENI